MIGYTSVGYGCQSALGWQIPCHSRRPLPCLLLQDCAEKLLCEQSQVSQPRSIDDSLERVVPWPDELHWLTGGHWTLDFKPQSDDILGENRSMVVHGGLRSTASWISGAAGNIWWSLAPGFFLPTRCLKDRAWAKKGSWGTDLWICVPKQDLLSRLGAVSTGLRTSVWREWIGNTESGGPCVASWVTYHWALRCHGPGFGEQLDYTSYGREDLSQLNKSLDWSTLTVNSILFVCVCVCVRKREREREETFFFYMPVF